MFARPPPSLPIPSDDLQQLLAFQADRGLGRPFNFLKYVQANYYQRQRRPEQIGVMIDLCNAFRLARESTEKQRCTVGPERSPSVAGYVLPISKTMQKSSRRIPCERLSITRSVRRFSRDSSRFRCRFLCSLPAGADEMEKLKLARFLRRRASCRVLSRPVA